MFDSSVPESLSQLVYWLLAGFGSVVFLLLRSEIMLRKTRETIRTNEQQNKMKLEAAEAAHHQKLERAQAQQEATLQRWFMGQMDSLRDEMSAVKDELADKNLLIDRLRNDLTQSQDAYAKLREDYLEIKRNLDTSALTIEQLTEQQETMRARIDSLQNELDQERGTNAQLRVERDSLKRDVAELRAEVAELTRRQNVLTPQEPKT